MKASRYRNIIFFHENIIEFAVTEIGLNFGMIGVALSMSGTVKGQLERAFSNDITLWY